MNHNQKSIKIQQTISKNKLKSLRTNYINSLLESLCFSEPRSDRNCHYRNRIYTPIQTLSMFVSQAINPDSSCQAIVDSFALTNKQVRSVSTGGYCRARKRLSENFISNIAKKVASLSTCKIKEKWKFRGQNIYLVDGTTFMMPDSIENQDKYRQGDFQKKKLKGTVSTFKTT